MQNNESLPINYRIEFYENSPINDPVKTFKTTSVPFSISIGDKVDPRSWENNNLPSGSIYQVTDVIHLYSVIENSHVFHSVSILVEEMDLPW